MPRYLPSVAVLAAALLSLPQLHAQATPAAGRLGGALQVGVGGTLLRPDYDSGTNYGLTVYTSFDVIRYAGVDAEMHLGGFISPHDITENTYLGGPRAMYHFHNATVYAKALFGRGTIKNTDTNQSSGFFTLAYGGGLEYRIRPHFNIRVIDFEQQDWPNFKPNGLSPITATIGVAYVLH